MCGLVRGSKRAKNIQLSGWMAWCVVCGGCCMAYGVPMSQWNEKNGIEKCLFLAYAIFAKAKWGEWERAKILKIVKEQIVSFMYITHRIRADKREDLHSLQWIATAQQQRHTLQRKTKEQVTKPDWETRTQIDFNENNNNNKNDVNVLLCCKRRRRRMHTNDVMYNLCTYGFPWNVIRDICRWCDDGEYQNTIYFNKNWERDIKSYRLSLCDIMSAVPHPIHLLYLPSYA